MNLDYKSLTNLSDASRREALQSMTQLYQRLSQSQLQLQHFSSSSCASCGSKRHADCSAKSSTTSSSSKDKKKHTSSSRQRASGPTITRMPLKSSSQPQLVVVRPKPSRKSSSNSTPSSSKSHSPSSSTYTSPLASPLPLYIAEEPYEIQTDSIIKGVLGGPMPPPTSSARRRKDSFNVAHDSRPSTWPEDGWLKYPYVVQELEHLHLPAPKLPTFTPTHRKQTTPVHAHTHTHGSTQKKTSSPTLASSTPKHTHPSPPPVSSVPRRRLDKVTPSSYTFASDSTKLGEIPQRNWATPWDYQEAERLNQEAALAGVPVVGKEDLKAEGKKKGMFRWMRRGSAAGVGA